MTSTVSKALRNIVAERDSYTCVLCENGYTDMHHVTPRSQGGRNNPYNLVSLCRRCHKLIHREISLPHDLDHFNEYLDLDQWLDEAEYRIAEYLGDYYAELYADDYLTILAEDDAYWNRILRNRELIDTVGIPVTAKIESLRSCYNPTDTAYVIDWQDFDNAKAIYRYKLCKLEYRPHSNTYYVFDVTGVLD